MHWVFLSSADAHILKRILEKKHQEFFFLFFFFYIGSYIKYNLNDQDARSKDNIWSIQIQFPIFHFFFYQILSRDVDRVKRITMAIWNTIQFLKSCFQWESTWRSAIAFVVSSFFFMFKLFVSQSPIQMRVGFILLT